LDASILEDGKENNSPESEREMLDSVQSEYALFDDPNVASSVGLVGDGVSPSEIDVQEENGNRTEKREQCNNRADPQCPGVGTKVLCDNIGS
jgi:hypothetical protein